jgi:hypothetical protein
VFIELKHDAPSESPAGTSGVASDASTNGARRVHDDERVTVWEQAWRPGLSKHTTRYLRETVVVFLEAGTMRVSTDGGESAAVELRPGAFRYRTRGTVETTEVVTGTPRALVFELK